MWVWDFFGKNGEVPQQQDGREGLAPMDSSSQADVMNKMQAISQLKAELDAIYPTLQSASQTHIRPHESVNLPIGHTTVNASVVQEEHETRRGSDGQSFAPQPARPPPAWYQDIKAREEWTTSIAKRVSKSPDSQADGLQLLEAQFVKHGASLPMDLRVRGIVSAKFGYDGSALPWDPSVELEQEGG